MYVCTYELFGAADVDVDRKFVAPIAQSLYVW